MIHMVQRLIIQLQSSKLSYGLNQNVDIMASDIKMNSRGSKFTLEYKDDSFEIELSIPGNYNIYNALGCYSGLFKSGNRDSCN